ncbi:MAG TPA: ABC transporter ATP-binding protein, partial [Thiobacillus sp.]|nr:ABC transporter ATP-binding protein [Thiobacillus sp.]
MNQATPAIRINALRKRFGATQALDGVSLDIEPGEFFGLLGPNG